MQTDPLLTRIEDALAACDISATKFGYLVAGDPALVQKMRGGRRLRPKLRAKVVAALDKLDLEGEL